MKNAKVVYYGNKEVLHLTMFSLPRGKEIIARLDNFLPQECPKYREDLLVLTMDGKLMNIGANVPAEVATKAVETNPVIDDSMTGFMVRPPAGYAIVSRSLGLALEKIEEVAPVSAAETHHEEAPVVVEQQSREAEPPPSDLSKPEGKKRRGRKNQRAESDPVFFKLAEGL